MRRFLAIPLLLTLLVCGRPAIADTLPPAATSQAGDERPPARLPGKGMMNAGLGLFISGYAAAYFTGMMVFSFEVQDRIDGRRGTTGANGDLALASGLLWVPVIGPLASAVTFREPAWSIPWAIAGQALQAVGLALMIQGARVQHRAQRSGLGLLPYTAPGGGGLALGGRF